MSKVVIFLGPPGSGKGTQASRLARELELQCLSTGEMLREHTARGTELGRQVAPLLQAGHLVPDEIVISMIREKLAGMEDIRVIFDGFPRTVAQAEALEVLLEELSCPIYPAVLLDAPQDELARRMLARAKLEGRSDDTPETIEHRFKVYHERTKPLVDYYAARGRLRHLDGTGTPEEVYRRLKFCVL